jgi:hypothetical protein
MFEKSLVVLALNFFGLQPNLFQVAHEDPFDWTHATRMLLFIPIIVPLDLLLLPLYLGHRLFVVARKRYYKHKTKKKLRKLEKEQAQVQWSYLMQPP